MPPTEDNDRARQFEHDLQNARQGCEQALGQLLQRCRPYLLEIARQQLGPDLQAKLGASDLVQETFLDAQQDFPHFSGQTEEELLAWLRQILLHTAGNMTRCYRGTDMRRIDREVALADVPPDQVLRKVTDDSRPPSEEMLAREEDEALAQALTQLPEHYRQVVEWRNYERCSFEEIGRRLGRSAGAARKLWLRALEELQARLGASP